MKQLFTLLFVGACGLAASAQQNIQYLGETEGNIKLTCETSGFGHYTVNTPLGDAWVLTLDEGSPVLRAGAPDLERYSVPLIVDNQHKMEVSIVEAEYTEYSNISVAPSKGNLYRTADPSMVAFSYGNTYEANEFYPGQLAALDPAFIQGAVRGQSLHFYPLQYNPVTKVLRLYTHLEVDVKVTDEPGENPLLTDNLRVNALMNEAYAGRYINYDPSRYDVVGELGNMLVITDGDYIDELAPWVQWKKEKGIPTEVVDVADIGNTVNAINAYVENYYNDNGLTYLVLVGDEDQVPTLMVNNGGGQGYCDACYGYISGSDSYAEVHVARLIVHTETELPGVISKILEYEKTPYVATDWFSVAMGIGSNEGDGFGDDGEADWEHQNDIKEDLLSFTYTEVWEKYDGSHTTASPTGGDTADGSGSPSSSSLTTVINEGCTLINYTGHGSHTSIVTGSYTNTQINALTNHHLYPYFIIVGCCTGDFDDDDASGDTFGEAWLKSMDGANPAGGIGGAFSSVYQSWAPPMEGQDEMVHIISEMVDYDTRHTLGSIHTNGCASMNDEYGGDGDEMTDTWHLFGDPTVQLRTAYPTNLDVDHQAQVFIGTNAIDVDCGTDGAMVCLTWNGEILGWGIVSGGSVTIEVPALNEPGMVLVTATAFNTVPSQTYIEVVPANGPYVVDEVEVLDDSLGNNDGQADHGESILLDVSLTNVGIETATGVSVALSSDDPNVTITDADALYGDIDPGDVPMIDNAFAFDVADGIEDQYEVPFTMTITDDQENIWIVDFDVVINAPELVCPLTLVVDDPEGNNNGRIDSGETVEISVLVSNDGHSDAEGSMVTLETASEYLTVLSGTVATGTIAEGGQVVAVFMVEAAASIPDGTAATFSVGAEAGLYDTACEFEETLDVIIEDSETGVLDGFNWQMDGDADWFVTTQSPYEGDYCMESGNIADGETTTLKTVMNVLEAGNIQFSYRTSTEASYDFLIFNINGSVMGQWSGDNDWTVVSYPVNPGSVTFRWRYDKDNIVSNGEDACWVDDIIFPPYEQSVTVVENENNPWDVLVFPNPAADQSTLIVSLSSASEVGVTITGTHGELVWQMPARILAKGDNNLQLPVQQFAAGVYMVQVKSDFGTQTTKLIVK